MMFEKIISSLIPQLRAVRWLPVIGNAVLVVLAIFLVRYVWIGRPQEFYQDGLLDGQAAANALCAAQEKLRADAIQKVIDDENKKRQKILSRAASHPADILERMRRGGL